MKKKLTITVDRDLIPRAKHLARERGISLSSIIEEGLRGLVGEAPEPFVEKWRGAFEPTDRSDPRYEYLMDKYG